MEQSQLVMLGGSLAAAVAVGVSVKCCAGGSATPKKKKAGTGGGKKGGKDKSRGKGKGGKKKPVPKKKTVKAKKSKKPKSPSSPPVHVSDAELVGLTEEQIAEKLMNRWGRHAGIIIGIFVVISVPVYAQSVSRESTESFVRTQHHGGRRSFLV